MTDHILLLSEKSSGSSIFQREIVKHSAINTVGWTRHTEAETLYWVKAASILGYPTEAFWAARPPFPPRWCQLSVRRILEHNLVDAPSAPVDWQYLKRGWELLIDAHGPVFMEKSPHHLNQWPALACINRFIAETDKDVRIIGLVRNPLSVIYSTYTRWNSEAHARQFMWEQSYRNLLAMQALHSDRMILLRYEDLISNPVEEFTRILAFVGLDYEHQIGKDLHARSLEKWLEDESFSFDIAPSVKALGRHFGYTIEEMRCVRDNTTRIRSRKHRKPGIISKVRSGISFYRNHVLHR